jgi:hypothetical protein
VQVLVLVVRLEERVAGEQLDRIVPTDQRSHGYDQPARSSTSGAR